MSATLFLVAAMLGGRPLTRPIEYDEQQTVDATRRVTALYAKCLVRKRKAQAAEYVLFSPQQSWDEPRAKKLVKRMSNGDCLIEAAVIYDGVQLRLPGDTLRYILAEELIRKDLLKAPPLSDLERVPALDHRIVDEVSSPDSDEARSSNPVEEREKNQKSLLARAVLSRFGECIVRRDAKKARDLMGTAVVSDDEDAALSALAPAFSACVPEGQSVTLNKAIARGAIAYNYYRLWHAAGASSSALADARHN